MPIRHVQRGILFVTLTYPRDWPGDWSAWKRQLDTWLKRVRRRLPGAAGVWKLEPQVRGAPHFHLLMIGAPYLGREWLSRTWYEVVGSGDPKHLAAGTNVQLAHSHRGVLAYAAKYTAKAQLLPATWQGGVGRWWGVFNRAGLGIEWRRVALWDVDYYALVRQLRHLIAHRQAARARGPPRACPAGMWAVVRDSLAERLVGLVVGHAAWVTVGQHPPAPESPRTAATWDSRALPRLAAQLGVLPDVGGLPW